MGQYWFGCPTSSHRIEPWGAPQGSIEQAVAQVEAFRGSLEHRVVARFDEAVSAGDLGAMSECARIMAEFRQGESQLVQAGSPHRPCAGSCTMLPVSWLCKPCMYARLKRHGLRR